MIPPIASNFVAGETPAEAIDHSHRLNDKDVGAILNLLGEHYETPEPAAEDRDEYLDLIADIASDDLDACLSVKPSQIGLDVGEGTFAENARLIVEHADEHDVFVWFDMEDHTTTDVTLDVYEQLVTEFGDVGLCLQANLKRTREDLERLAPLGGKLRLVKGAYDEPAEISYKDKARVDEEYRELLNYAFEHCTGTVAVGSHDPEMIEHGIERHEETGTPVELQLLMGVREEAQFEHAEEYPVYQYVPYGSKWLSYFYRRLMERKENALFGVRAVLTG
jgi:proline dehydrogenase